MKRRDYLKNMGLSSLGLAVFNPDEKAIENLELAKVPVKRPNGRTQDIFFTCIIDIVTPLPDKFCC